MLEIEIDGKSLQVGEGSTIMDAARQLGTYIPHFCYHKKLSIAANCRMCLVQVEKAPKPLPACATPVTNGMKVMTHSELAVKAQKGVMEFLLINHPLDCPICDQGGECQLQDLSVGYGAGTSRYNEEKRVVVNKNLGPLVATDMTRCIHCTRCVRFTQEIAGNMELGQAFRGEHAEIMPFVEKTVDSELSGNIIDLCPVGALTSKPFRFSARTWELSRRKSVSPHDGLGANLIVQVKHDEVKRVLPLDNEELNECWLSDKDRFSYEALNSEQRLTKPMLKQGGVWREVDWETALEYVANGLQSVVKQHGKSSVSALATPNSTLEELYLLQKLARGLGGSVDFRLRHSDFSGDGKRLGAPWLGMKVAEINNLDRVLVVGSFLRKDQPLLALRLRQAVKKGAQVSVIHAADEDLLMPLIARSIVAPELLVSELAQVVIAAAALKGAVVDSALNLPSLSVSESAQQIAASLVSGNDSAVFLGNFAEQSPYAAQLQALAQELVRIVGGRFGFLGEAANSVGGYLANAAANSGSLNVAQILSGTQRALVVLNAELELDCYDSAQAKAALTAAETVVVLSAFKSAGALEYADVLLPVSPFAETSGTFVNTEGRVQSFNAVSRPKGDSRPAWKVLRVLGNLLEIPGFDQDSSEAVKKQVLGLNSDVSSKLSNGIKGVVVSVIDSVKGFTRVADVPIYAADALVRRSSSLQKTRDAQQPVARMNSQTLAQVGVVSGDKVKLSQGAGSVTLDAELDDGVATGGVRVAAAYPSVAVLGGLQGRISVERA